jgi:hypothetical protein
MGADASSDLLNPIFIGLPLSSELSQAIIDIFIIFTFGCIYKVLVMFQFSPIIGLTMLSLMVIFLLLPRLILALDNCDDINNSSYSDVFDILSMLNDESYSILCIKQPPYYKNTGPSNPTDIIASFRVYEVSEINDMEYTITFTVEIDIQWKDPIVVLTDVAKSL